MGFAVRIVLRVLGDGCIESDARRAQSRVCRVDVDSQRVGGFAHGHLFQLDEDQDGSLVVIHLIEEPMKERSRLPLGNELARSLLIGWRARIELNGVDFHEVRLTAANRAPVTLGDAQDNAEEPRPHLGSPLKLCKAPVHHEEHVLHGVLQGGLLHAQAAQIPPNKPDVLRVNLGQRGRQLRSMFVPGQWLRHLLCDSGRDASFRPATLASRTLTLRSGE
jgi:hypothetical protein